MYHSNSTFYLLLLFLMSNLTVILAAIEGLKCQQGQIFNTNQAIFVQDFGPQGVQGPINVTIANTLQPGAVISVVTKSEIQGTINLLADDIYVLHVDARIQQGILVINTSKRLIEVWETEVRQSNPVISGGITTTTFIYEADGYRIFINGKEIAFYPHRSDRAPQVIHLLQDYIYKVMYMTTETIETENYA